MLVISVIAHAGAIATRIPQLLELEKKHQELKKIKLTYIKAKDVPGPDFKKIVTKDEPLLDLSRVKISGETGRLPQPKISKEDFFKPLSKTAAPQQVAVKPFTPKPDLISVKKKIVLPAIDMGKMNNPSYMSYYQFVREKIRRSAYQNYAKTETGEIYLSFIIARNGTLQDIRLIEDKSSSSMYLRELAIRSVRTATPFTEFPKELDYPQLSFNVIISFEIE